MAEIQRPYVPRSLSTSARIRRFLLVVTLCLIAGGYAYYSRRALPPGLSPTDLRSLANAVLPETAACLKDAPTISIDFKNATSEAIDEGSLKALLFAGLNKPEGPGAKLNTEITLQEKRTEKLWHLTYVIITTVAKPDGTQCKGQARLSRVGRI